MVSACQFTYLWHHGDKDLVIGLGVVVEGILVVAELHGHLDTLIFAIHLLALGLSRLVWHSVVIYTILFQLFGRV